MEKKGNQFNTFAGVFTPSILTIFGVIMFLRAGYVIGQAGIVQTIWILVCAEAICVLTALSIGVIATNTPVRGGGAYFLISRALGPQFGGAIGLALFLAQALSVPFYALGFTNSLVQTFPILSPWVAVIATAATLGLFAITWISAEWAIRSQYVVMTILGLSILSFLGGALIRFDPALYHANLSAQYTDRTVGFWLVFAIYFPAVTGILAGVNMSGDLKDPARSLVRGTMASIGVGFAVYLIEIVLCGGSQSRADLVGRPFETLVRNALFGTGFLVIGGVFAATLSSAIGSFLGAPRVLQALARDRIFKSLGSFARGTPDRDEPRLALGLTLAMTLGVIWLASHQESMAAFDTIASVVTMFFLCTYGMVNLAAFVESFGANPSFRPRFRFHHWSVSLLGFILSVGAMLLVDPVTAVVAAVSIAAVVVFLSRREFESAFGDARRGFQYTLAVRSLQGLRHRTSDPKNWRPTFLAMVGNSQRHLPLIRYAHWMEGGRGLVMAAQVISGDLQDFAARVEGLRSAMEAFLRTHDLKAMPEVVFARDVDEGIRMLVQAHSIGPLKPNTVLYGWPKKEERAEALHRHIRDTAALGKSVVIVVDKGLPTSGRTYRQIDVWWRGHKNGSLMVTLAHLLTRNWEWRGSTLRILRVVTDAAGQEPSREAVRKLIQAARITAEAEVVVSTAPFSEVLKAHSRYADVVFLGFQMHSDRSPQEEYRHTQDMLEGLPTTILVHSIGEADLFV